MAIRPSALLTRNSRYVLGGTTEMLGDALGFWEPASTAALNTYAQQEWAVTAAYIGRPDLIANLFYGTPSLGWLILQHNNIVDDLEELVEGAVLFIPDPERVQSALTSLKASDTVRAI